MRVPGEQKQPTQMSIEELQRRINSGRSWMTSYWKLWFEDQKAKSAVFQDNTAHSGYALHQP